MNAITFYFELLLGMPNRFYEIERLRKEFKLTVVLVKDAQLAVI